jgi:putative solute:sodium symporter small subunit
MLSETVPISPYWRKTLRLSGILLAAWFVLTLGVGLFGRALNFRLFSWPFGFWVTAQVALVGYCVIVWVYALAMDRLDLEHGGHAGD